MLNNVSLIFLLVNNGKNTIILQELKSLFSSTITLIRLSRFVRYSHSLSLSCPLVYHCHYSRMAMSSRTYYVPNSTGYAHCYQLVYYSTTCWYIHSIPMPYCLQQKASLPHAYVSIQAIYRSDMSTPITMLCICHCVVVRWR